MKKLITHYQLPIAEQTVCPWNRNYSLKLGGNKKVTFNFLTIINSARQSLYSQHKCYLCYNLFFVHNFIYVHPVFILVPKNRLNRYELFLNRFNRFCKIPAENVNNCTLIFIYSINNTTRRKANGPETVYIVYNSILPPSIPSIFKYGFYKNRSQKSNQKYYGLTIF